jgi:hypothetical protein
MENRKSLIVTGFVVLGIILLLFGTVWFLFSFIRGRQQVDNDIFAETTPTPIAEGVSPSPTILGVASPTPLATAGGTSSLPGTGVSGGKYTGNGFHISYPTNWGVLTCNNSLNLESFELDPLNSTNQLNVRCVEAIKPVTVLVKQNNNCAGVIGHSATIGSIEVVKSITKTATGTNYRWCTKTVPSLDITHRVSSESKAAYSTKDYSFDVEQMISTFKTR